MNFEQYQDVLIKEYVKKIPEDTDLKKELPDIIKAIIKILMKRQHDFNQTIVSEN